MSTIEPVNFPIYGEATILNVVVQSFPTNAVSTNTYWTLSTSDGVKCAEGMYYMTDEQFAAWGQDNTVVDDYVAEAIGVVIIPTPPTTTTTTTEEPSTTTTTTTTSVEP